MTSAGDHPTTTMSSSGSIGSTAVLTSRLDGGVATSTVITVTFLQQIIIGTGSSPRTNRGGSHIFLCVCVGGCWGWGWDVVKGYSFNDTYFFEASTS